MKKTIYFCVVSLATASAASGSDNSNNTSQVGFFDSEDAVNRLRNEAPNSIQSNVDSFTIETDVSNDLEIWDTDDVQQFVQEHNLTEA